MHATITAHLDTPTIGKIGMLDGPLAWAAWQDAEQRKEPTPPITDTYVHDYDLGLEKWSIGGYWGWCISTPILAPQHYSSAEFRRRPPATPLGIYTKDREFHTGLGPLKARNVTLSTEHHQTISWNAHIADPERISQLLAHITHLGARHRNGYGHVTHWEITQGPTDGWGNRPLPNPGGMLMRVRAPYWHPTERTPCA